MSDCQLAFQRQGQGTSLVLVHGFLGGSAMWRDQIAYLSTSFDVIAPDLPGYAASKHVKHPNSIVEYAECVLEFLSKLGVEEFYLLGHSMGGMIVQQMSLLAPTRVKKLITYGTGPVGVLPGRFETIAQSRHRIETEGLATAAERIAATWFVAGKDAPGYALCKELGAQASISAALACLGAWEDWNVSSDLDRINAPTLVLWGDRDQSYLWAQPEALWRGIPDSYLAVVPGCAHNVHMEKPDLFNRLVADFLA